MTHSKTLHPVHSLENLHIPPELSGERGVYRANGSDCRIDANNDIDAIAQWLDSKKANLKTWIAYKKELERLAMWAIVERDKAVSSLTSGDCQAYLQFLKTLSSDNAYWVTTQPPNKNYGHWKPFYYKPRKRAQDDTPQTVLSAKSVNYAKTVISNCMDWLVRQNYLKYNNFQDIAALKTGQSSLSISHRSFSAQQIQMLFDYAQSLIGSEPKLKNYHRRTLLILKFAFSTGLRIHELAAARYGDIVHLDAELGRYYFLEVQGKGHKIRNTSLPDTLLNDMRHYLQAIGIAVPLEQLPAEQPIIGNLRDKTGLKTLTPAAIHKVLSKFFAQMLEHLEACEHAEPQLLLKLKKASAHWLRHSYGSFLANDKNVPLTYIRDELGHSNISTTSVYLNSDEKNRRKTVDEAFAAFNTAFGNDQ